MITSIRYRGFSFYYKDNDNKYKEIFDEILAYNFKTVKVLRNIDDTKVSLMIRNMVAMFLKSLLRKRKGMNVF